MKWNPQHDLVVLRPAKQAEKTLGGVVIPDTARKLLDEGVVAELGPNVDQERFKPNGLKVGDRVLVRRYSGSWLKIAQGNDSLSGGDENNRLIIEAEDILTVPTDD